MIRFLYRLWIWLKSVFLPRHGLGTGSKDPSPSDQAFPSAWARHRASRCLFDCFYCHRPEAPAARFVKIFPAGKLNRAARRSLRSHDQKVSWRKRWGKFFNGLVLLKKPMPAAPSPRRSTMAQLAADFKKKRAQAHEPPALQEAA